ncbi:MAG: hypothetical protein LBD35_04525 [Prevotellaceae bacterium]|jgi:hypothetical protein|nr:hypothetical protein [Prevotellaceae bacterium]
MYKKIDANILKMEFADRKSFSAQEAFSLYSAENNEITMHNIYWLIHSLTQKGIINKVSRGVYAFGAGRNFTPVLSTKSKTIYRQIRKQFRYVDFCVWELSVVNLFACNLINFNIIFVDIERAAIDAVYYFLKEKNKYTFKLSNTKDELVGLKNSVCVRPLVTQSPLIDFESIKTASLEKILVDLAADKEFFPFQGNEIEALYQSAFEHIAINKNALLRYAGRKEKREIIRQLLEIVNCR